jgi:hypothetical protein
VQDGKIKVKGTAPIIFTDELEITYRNDTSVKTTVKIERVFVPLQSVILSTADGRNKCPAGSNIKINVNFIPQNASDKYVVYEIESGEEFAGIDENGVLSVNKNAEIGTEIKICVTPKQEDTVATEIVITVSSPLIIKPVTLLKWREGGYIVQQWLYTSDYDSWQDIDLDFRELSIQGYELVTFEWTISVTNDKNGNGTAEPEIKVELYNGSLTKTIYYNQDAGWGIGWEEYTVIFARNIDNILSFNQIRCAFRDWGEDEHYSVAWSSITMTVS